MSWQQYVDQNLVGTGAVQEAAILGLDGSSWAASSGFKVDAGQGKTIAAAIGPNVNSLSGTGMTINGVKYMFLRGDESSAFGKKGATGICVVKTKQALIVAKYGEGQQAGQCNTVTLKLADYLTSVGY